MSDFKVGDYVQVVEMRGEGAEDYHERRADYLGMVGRITDIAGADYPYSVEFGGEVSYHWFNADELTAIAPATAPTAAAQGEGADYAKGYDAGLLDGYTGVNPEWVARFEARQAQLEAALQQAQRERDAAQKALGIAQFHLNEIATPAYSGNWDEIASERRVLAQLALRRIEDAASAQQAAQPADGADTPVEPAKFAVGEWVEVRQPDGRPFADRMLVCRVFDDLGWRYALKDAESDPVPGTIAPESNLRKIEG